LIDIYSGSIKSHERASAQNWFKLAMRFFKCFLTIRKN